MRVSGRWRALAAGIAALGLAGGPAGAQSLEPMRGEIVSFADRFAVKVYPGNPYPTSIRIDVGVYDAAYRPIAAFVAPRGAVIGSGQRRRVLVIVPFEGETRREVRICAEASPVETGETRIRAQTCGRFIATRHAP